MPPKLIFAIAAFDLTYLRQYSLLVKRNKVTVICLVAGLTFWWPAHAQRVEALIAFTSLNVTQTQATASAISLGSGYTLLTQQDRNSYDDIGYRLAAAARWKLGRSGFFAQPEVAFTNTRGQSYVISYYRVPQFPDGDIFAHRIHRWEVALLGGKHTGRHTYVLLGPVLAFNQQEKLLAAQPGSIAAVYNSLYQTVLPVQLLAQAGVGVTWGRFDFNLRLEQSLTPYTRRGTFDRVAYGYEQHIRQGILTAGFLLYKPKPAAQAATP